jgi:sirohydrochlorin cobaltochelatase
MLGPLDSLLATLLQPGHFRTGQVEVTVVDSSFEMRHEADADRTDLEVHEGAAAARELSLYDDAGEYRPLKTAPNLRRGWRLGLRSLAEVHRALDYFYPAMLGVWRDFQRAQLPIVPLRETLERQTGMYAITKKITDAQAQTMVGDFCRSDTGCRKKILWDISPGVPVTTLPPEKFQPTDSGHALPLLCHESCNLLVAKAREVVKSAKAS